VLLCETERLPVFDSAKELELLVYFPKEV
jgi:hypothetical protein